jgi:outer membrane lipoprotein-sorting protein
MIKSGLLFLLAATGGAFDLDALMALLADVTERHADFTETKTDPMLMVPVIVSGRLLWRAPDRVEKITTAPREESFVIDGSTVTITRPPDITRSIPVNADPRLTGLVESLRAVLAGDRKGLERYFTLAMTGDRSAWRLTLTPRTTSMREALVSVVYTGRDARIETVVTTDASGVIATMSVITP